MADSHISGPLISEQGFQSTGGSNTFVGTQSITGQVNVTGGIGVSGAVLQGGTVGTDGSAAVGPNYAPISVAAIVDNTITTVATITCPNVAAAGVYRIFGGTTLTGAGAYQSTRVFEYVLTLSRNAGAALVGLLTPIEQSATNPVTNVNQLVTSTQSTVAAGATITSTTLALGTVAGAVGATNTIAIRVTTVASVAQVSQTILKIDGINFATGGITIAA